MSDEHTTADTRFPERSAVLTMEMQRGICGDLASFPALREAVESTGAARAAGRLTAAARAAGRPVVHCTFSMRPDRVGAAIDLPMMGAARKNPDYLLEGSPAVELVPELDQQPTDIVVDRHHGMSPFWGTGLDPMLRSLGVDTLVVAGVSANVGVIGLTIEAINIGYRVVIASDAVAGIPVDYGRAVITNSLAPIAKIATVEALL